MSIVVSMLVVPVFAVEKTECPFVIEDGDFRVTITTVSVEETVPLIRAEDWKGKTFTEDVTIAYTPTNKNIMKYRVTVGFNYSNKLGEAEVYKAEYSNVWIALDVVDYARVSHAGYSGDKATYYMEYDGVKYPSGRLEYTVTPSGTWSSTLRWTYLIGA